MAAVYWLGGATPDRVAEALCRALVPQSLSAAAHEVGLATAGGGALRKSGRPGGGSWKPPPVLETS